MGKPVKPVNRVTRVNTPIIFLNFFMTIFFQFYYFVLNYLPLRFVIFLLFLLFVYYESMLVKLTRTGTRYFKGFFTEFWLLYWVILSKKKNYTDLISQIVGLSSYPGLTRVFFFDVVFFEVFCLFFTLDY
jgi:hypothetical protein